MKFFIAETKKQKEQRERRSQKELEKQVNAQSAIKLMEIESRLG